MFKIGDRVMINANYPQGDLVGMEGIVCDICENWFGIRFDELNRDYFHTCDGACESGHGYYVYGIYLELVSSGQQTKLKITTRKCSCCGQSLPLHSMKKTKNKKYVCNDCYSIKAYHTQNFIMIHRAKKHGKTYGFEFECIPYSDSDRATLCDQKYAFLPTSDASLPFGGVEFKSPTYYSLNGLKPIFRTLVKHADFINPDCGQHINIGDIDHINGNTMAYILSYASQIFNPLYYYMARNPTTTEFICGRYFTLYADLYSYDSHSSWINLLHNNRIEFRLSKMQNPTQYFQLVCMWTEMVDSIITWFLVDPCNKNAEKVSKKLIKIFQKYENGKASCQRPERNSIKTRKWNKG